MLSNLNKSYVATDWVAIANISGVGTSIVTTAPAKINIPKVSMVDWILELELTMLKTAGTGFCQAWTLNSGSVSSSGRGVIASAFYTEAMSASDIGNQNPPIKRTVRLKPSELGLDYTYLQDRINVGVEGRGTAADTAWLVSDIRARLIYLPL